jgi:hypothetical protein
MTLYPIGYGSQLVTMEELRAKHEPNMHPEFARRLFAWIKSRNGEIGIGGGFRTTQPNKPGFAPDGRSFHQLQEFSGGRKAYAAVDLVARSEGVHRAPRWHEVPAQDSAEAALWGVHCNVGNAPTGEPWHMQPIELDGWGRWSIYRPELEPNRPLPQEETMGLTAVEPKVIFDSRREGNSIVRDFQAVPIIAPELKGCRAVLVAVTNISKRTEAVVGHIRVASNESQAALDASPGWAHTEVDGVESSTLTVLTPDGVIWVQPRHCENVDGVPVGTDIEVVLLAVER